MTDPTNSFTPKLPCARVNLFNRGPHNMPFMNNIEFQAICVNVPLPPQAYDSFNTVKRRRRSSKTTIKVILEYPKPAIPYKYEYLYIGANKTLIPWQFYVKIPWYSYQLAASFLAEYIFEADILSTHKLHGKKQLDRFIVEDIVVHVGERCNVPEEYVIFVIAKLCADFARYKRRRGPNMDLAVYKS